MALYKDPRLDPTLRPDQWAAAARWRRIVAVVKLLLLAVVVAGPAVYFLYPVDRTKEMTAEQIARTAGEALLEVPAYRFTVDITGKSADQLFLTARMQGAYQRNPKILHLAGEVESGEGLVDLEYYLDGTDLYLKDPRTGDWLLVANANLDELYAFQPDNLAAPLVTGLLGAEVVGRERLSAGEAVVLRLDLDPQVMLPKLTSLHDDPVEYMLWVDARTLMPARFDIEVEKASDGVEAEEDHARRFSYRLVWDFEPWEEPLTIPDEVTSAAVNIDEESEEPDLLMQRRLRSGPEQERE